MASQTAYRYKYPHPAVSVDLCIFTLKNNDLHLLLIERGGEPFKGQWALPGGFVRIDEDLADAAQRELREETGLLQGFLEQVGAFGEVQRDPRERVISVAFYAVISTDKVALQAGTDARQVCWRSLAELPALAFDHLKIVESARARLGEKINRTTLALEFLPAEFTLTELQEVFEAVQGEAIDKRNFRKWAEALAFINATGRTRRGGQHRPAALFKSNARGVTAAPALVPEAAAASDVQGAAKLESAYRKGYEDALSAMHKSMVDAERALLKTVSPR